MTSTKKLQPNGLTRLIVVKHDSGAYSCYTPKEAAQMINELKRQLWNGLNLK